MALKHPLGPPMDLASMRAQGVHNLIAYWQKHIPAVSELKSHAG